MTARQCNKAPAELLGIEDQEIAFAFNVQVAEIFYLWEQEQESKRIEAMLGVGITKMTQDAVSEVTPTNFRDQSY